MGDLEASRVTANIVYLDSPRCTIIVAAPAGYQVKQLTVQLATPALRAAKRPPAAASDRNSSLPSGLGVCCCTSIVYVYTSIIYVHEEDA